MNNSWKGLVMSTLLFIAMLIALLALAATHVHAASLKVCAKDIDQDTAALNLYVGPVKANSYQMSISTPPSTELCYIITPVPVPPVVRGTLQPYTLRAANAAGEESVASSAITFRFPSVPSTPTFLSVGATVP